MASNGHLCSNIPSSPGVFVWQSSFFSSVLEVNWLPLTTHCCQMPIFHQPFHFQTMKSLLWKIGVEESKWLNLRKFFPSSKKCAKSLSWTFPLKEKMLRIMIWHIFWRMEPKWKKSEIKLTSYIRHYLSSMNYYFIVLGWASPGLAASISFGFFTFFLSIMRKSSIFQSNTF